MLYLLVRPGSDAYAIEAVPVQLVAPFTRLKHLPSGLPEVAGVLNFHGRALPVIDLTLLLTGNASREHLSTRIIITEIALPGTGTLMLGLLAEGVESVARFPADAFQPSGVQPDKRPWLGPLIEHAGGLVQRLDLARLLPADVLLALTRTAEDALPA